MSVTDGPAFPPPNRRSEPPYRTAGTVASHAPRRRPVVVHRPSAPPDEHPFVRGDDIELDATPAGPPERRLGFVVPLAGAGVAFCVGGASILHDWWTSRGGGISSSLLIMCLVAGPALILVAIKVFRDPSF